MKKLLLLLLVLSPSLDAHKIIPLKRLTYEVQNFTPTDDVLGIGEFRGFVEGKIYDENLRVTAAGDCPIVLKNLDEDTVKGAREKLPLFKVALNIGNCHYEGNYAAAGQEKLVFKDCSLSCDGFTLFLNKNIAPDRNNFEQRLKAALNPQNAISINHAEISPANDVQVNEGVKIQVGKHFNCLSTHIQNSLCNKLSSEILRYRDGGFCPINRFDNSVFMAAELASCAAGGWHPEIFFLLEKDTKYARFVIKVYFLVRGNLFQVSCMYPRHIEKLYAEFERDSYSTGYTIFRLDWPENFDMAAPFQPLLFKVEGAGYFPVARD